MSEQKSPGGNDHSSHTNRQTKRVAMTIEKLPRNQILLPPAVLAKLHGRTRFSVSAEDTTLILNPFGGKYDEINSILDFFAESCDRTWGPPDCEQLERVAKLTPKKRVTLPLAFKSHYEGVKKFELTMKGTALILRPLRDR